MRLPEKLPIYERNKEYDFSKLIGYMFIWPDKKFSWDKIVELPVSLSDSIWNKYSDFNDRFYVHSKLKGYWITAVIISASFRYINGN